MHAFRANGNAPIQFWRVGARAESTQPALCKYSCLQGGSVQDYFTFCTSHTWNLSDGAGGNYQQTDTLDPGTFEPTAATVDVNTYSPGGLFGSPPVWNDLTGYNIGALLTPISTVDWDPSSSRAGITAALDGVNWTALWAASLTEQNDFKYDRVQIGFDQEGVLPFTGGTRPFGNNPCTGNLIGAHNNFGPTLILTGVVGDLGTFGRDATSVSDNLGISLSRSQIQIRNFRGAPIPYFIYEQADVAGSVTILGGNTQRVDSSIVLADTAVYYRKVSDGTWTADRQIIQLPDAAMDGPQSITAPAGAKVRSGTVVSMVVGMTFEDYMAATLGPSWADYVFT